MTARTKENLCESFNKFLESQNCQNIIYNHEDTGNNPHNHWLFETTKTKDTLNKAKTRYFNKESIEWKKDDVVFSICQDPIKYRKYLCKGYNVSLKKGQGCEEPEDPRVIGMNVNEVMKLHKEFWETNSKSLEIKQKKKASSTTTHFSMFRQWMKGKILETELDAFGNEVPTTKVMIKQYLLMCKSKGLMIQKEDYMVRMFKSYLNWEDKYTFDRDRMVDKIYEKIKYDI